MVGLFKYDAGRHAMVLASKKTWKLVSMSKFANGIEESYEMILGFVRFVDGNLNYI